MSFFSDIRFIVFCMISANIIRADSLISISYPDVRSASYNQSTQHKG